MGQKEYRLFENGAVVGDRYRIQGLIGQGGMGEVYAAEDLRLQGKIRALKASRASAGCGLRTAEEAGLLMELNHPHVPLIVDYYPADERDGYEIMVMDYIDGLTLQSYLEQQGGLVPAAKAVEIGLQLAEALRYLHGRQPPIIHRDLKPTNVMIDRSGFVRLIDFGIARVYKPGQEMDTARLGTPGFAAPEQEGERQSDERTDIYGLGALLYYLLTGGGRIDSNAGASGHGLHASKGMQALLGGMPAIAAAIFKMTDPDPASRYGSMEEVSRALGDGLQGAAATAAGSAASAFDGPSRGMAAPATGSLARLMSHRNRQRSVIVASLSPGAGGTFIAITLAHLLGQMNGATVAAVEHPALEPEWHALLPLTGRDGYSDSQPEADNRYAKLTASSGGPEWYRLEPSVHSAAGQSAELQLKHRMMLQAIRASVVVTDVSGRWLSPEMEKQLATCDCLLFVVDPFPSKWTIERLAAAGRICGERGGGGRTTHWIANKDGKFGARAEWLAAMPAKPSCSVPLLPAREWADEMWRGRWATANKRWRSQLERALAPVLGSLAANV